jgi:hypothetical protein
LESNIRDFYEPHPKKHAMLQFECVEINSPGIQAIEDNISSSEYQTTLKQEYALNCSKGNLGKFQFFTDRSLGKTKDQTIKMSAS